MRGSTPEILDAWHTLRAANPLLDSPYFHPGFARAVHASGRAVELIVVRDLAQAVTAILPVHRERALLRPVGWPGADFQGPILAPGTEPAVKDLLTGGAKAYQFDHLLDGLADFGPWTESTMASPYLDVAGGLDGYLGRASKSGKDNMGQARRRLAQTERKLGTVKFAADNADPAVLDRVIELKRGQYAATGAKDYFAEPDRRDLLERLLRTREPDFGGILSTLHAGDQLIAAHFGLRSGGVLHWWFPVYDPEYSKLAPGWMLLRELVAAAPELGVTRIDLGRGDDEYKRRAKTGETLVHQGLLTGSSARLALRRAQTAAIAGVKASPLAPGLRRIVRTLRTKG
jgi:CelD/BcsL family acetyltransferase involved in cellulose biosynthesis